MLAVFNNLINFVFPIKIETVFDWSLIISVIGIILYFLGKLIIERRPLEDDRNNFIIYFNGLLYFLFYTLLPILIVDVFIKNKIYIRNQVFFLIFCIFIYAIISFYSRQIIVHSLHIDKLVKNRTQKHSLDLIFNFLKKSKLKGTNEQIMARFNWIFELYQKIINLWKSKLILFLFSLLNIFIIFNSFKLNFNIAVFLVIIVSSFLAFCSLIILFALASFKTVEITVVLKNGDVIKGDLIKRNENKLVIDKNHEAMHISISEIKYYKYKLIDIKKWDKNINKKMRINKQ